MAAVVVVVSKVQSRTMRYIKRCLRHNVGGSLRNELTIITRSASRNTAAVPPTAVPSIAARQPDVVAGTAIFTKLTWLDWVQALRGLSNFMLGLGRETVVNVHLARQKKRSAFRVKLRVFHCSTCDLPRHGTMCGSDPSANLPSDSTLCMR